MYVSTLGATKEKKCVTSAQALEALRLCNCKLYGWPEGPVKGLGQTNIKINLEAGKGGVPCDPVLRVDMPSDFNPQDPCEAAGRLTCEVKQRMEIAAERERQDQAREEKAAEEAAEEAASYEEQVADQSIQRQRLIVGGVATAVLLAVGFLVYRSTRSN